MRRTHVHILWRSVAAIVLSAGLLLVSLAPAWAKPPSPTEAIIPDQQQAAPTPEPTLAPTFVEPVELPRVQTHRFWRTFLPLASSVPAALLSDGMADTYVLKEGDDLNVLALELGLDVGAMACVTPSGTYALDQLRPGMTINLPDSRYVCHTVLQGETLDQIAEHYQVDARVIVETAWNELERADEPMEPGRRLLIFDGKRPDLKALREAAAVTAQQQLAQAPSPATPAAPAPQPTSTAPLARPPQPSEPVEPIQPALPVTGTLADAVPPEWADTVYRYGTGQFIWPVAGEISQGYHARHRALDIATPIGTPVLAADNGVVIKAGYSDVGYGGRVIIDHHIDYITLYAHLSRSMVEEGDVVKKGQVIGYVGSTGNSTGPHLHFELRDFGYLIDPRTVLPPK